MKSYIGSDIEEVSRFRFLLEHKPKLLPRIFHKNELDYALNKKNPHQSLAGIWCAKEAVVKAFGELFEITPRCVNILRNQNGVPKCLIVNERVRDFKFSISVSISHTKEYACSSAIITVLNNNEDDLY